MMTTADLSLRFDPIYEPISRRFHKDPEAFADAFARAWFKLTHRDMGPKARYLGPEVPAEDLIWQDPVPAVDHPLIDAKDIADLKAKVLASGLSVAELVSTAWASASTFRGSDKRGGANGARIRLAPQKDWEVNQPAQLAKVLGALETIQKAFNAAQTGGKKVSWRTSSCWPAAPPSKRRPRPPGTPSRCPSPRAAPTPRRSRPMWSRSRAGAQADGFRNYQKKAFTVSAEEMLVDKAQLLTLSAPEMTVLVGGLRVLGANAGQSRTACSRTAGTLTNDFFVNLLDMGTVWKPTSDAGDTFEGRDRKTGDSSGPAPAWTWSSAPTRSCAPWPRSMRRTMRRRSSCATSSRPGTRS
jgi:catalase-peroxidase